MLKNLMSWLNCFFMVQVISFHETKLDFDNFAQWGFFFNNTKPLGRLSDPICLSSLLSGRLSERLTDSEADTHGSD